MNATPHDDAVLVLGYGEMGRGMRQLLAHRESLAVWNRSARAGLAPLALEAAAARADVLIFCLPTAAHAPVLGRIRDVLKPGSIGLSVAKGVDDQARPVSRILEDALGPGREFGVLHGPMIAEEIQAGRHAFAQLGYRGSDVVGRVTALFAGTRLHVAPASDMIGINWAVILKNVYAMAFGIADELQLGDNARGWLAVTALQEIDTIVQRLGGSPGTARGLAGLGDLVTTATSEHSHHHALGRRLAHDDATALEGEAIHTLQVLARHRPFDDSGLPLLQWIGGMVRTPGDARERLGALLDAR